jgi:hypothetical protein
MKPSRERCQNKKERMKNKNEGKIRKNRNCEIRRGAKVERMRMSQPSGLSTSLPKPLFSTILDRFLMTALRYWISTLLTQLANLQIWWEK